MILIIGILAGVAAPKVLSISSTSIANTTLTNVRIIFDAAEVYTAQHGVLPRSASAGDFPRDFDNYLPEKLFTESHELGGHLVWNGSGTPGTAFGVVLTPTGPFAQWADFYSALEQADDGVTTTGWIKYIGGAIRFHLQDKSRNPRIDSGVAQPAVGI